MTLITCKNLSKIYKSGAVALNKINVAIDMKGVFALIGRNGAGKTTLVRILSTSLLPTTGDAKIDDVDVVKGAKRIRERIAVVPQEAGPIPWMTPTENILAYLMWRGFSYKEAKNRALEVLKLLGISKFKDTLNTKISGGTKRKVLVGMAIVSGADIIFLDEPTTGLDPMSRAEMWDILSKLKTEHLIFLTTHYLEEAEALADKIGILEAGKLLAINDLAGLRRKMGYPYSIKILDDSTGLKVKTGRITKGHDGHTQILTTEREARKLCLDLIQRRVKFSTNPVSLEDIFYYFVKKSLDNNESDEGSDHEKQNL